MFKNLFGVSFIRNNINDLKSNIKNFGDKDSSNIEESFNEALERFGIDINDKEKRANFIFQKYESFYKISLIYFIFSILVFSLFLYYLLIGSYFSSVLVVSFFFLFFVNFLSLSFRSYQMRRQNLCKFKEFLLNVKEWLPKKVYNKDFFYKNEP